MADLTRRVVGALAARHPDADLRRRLAEAEARAARLADALREVLGRWEHAGADTHIARAGSTEVSRWRAVLDASSGQGGDPR